MVEEPRGGDCDSVRWEKWGQETGTVAGGAQTRTGNKEQLALGGVESWTWMGSVDRKTGTGIRSLRSGD